MLKVLLLLVPAALQLPLADAGRAFVVLYIGGSGMTAGGLLGLQLSIAAACGAAGVLASKMGDAGHGPVVMYLGA
jgi:hypothetical protein